MLNNDKIRLQHNSTQVNTQNNMTKKYNDAKMLDRFVREYAWSGSMELACKKAGITEVTGYSWINRPEIGMRIRAQTLTELQKLAPKALFFLVKTMESEATPLKLKTEIARDLMDRAGYGKAAKNSGEEGARIEAMSKDQLLTYIKNLEAEVIDITPESETLDDKTLKLLE